MRYFEFGPPNIPTLDLPAEFRSSLNVYGGNSVTIPLISLEKLRVRTLPIKMRRKRVEAKKLPLVQ